eukprot:2908930-Ditylum_brightwellii.AAC.1
MKLGLALHSRKSRRISAFRHYSKVNQLCAGDCVVTRKQWLAASAQHACQSLSRGKGGTRQEIENKS